jgi:hypothetical protein
MTSRLPTSASIVNKSAGDKLYAPSAAKNVGALTKLLVRIAPEKGQILEIASGTGQHIVEFAKAIPDLLWTPSEISSERLVSIDAYCAEASLNNLTIPILLDACAQGWAQKSKTYDFIITINLLHLISKKATRVLLSETAKALTVNGTFIIYGPFLREGKTISNGDAVFHAELQNANRQIGYKDRDDVIAWALLAGLTAFEVVNMPANNLALIFKTSKDYNMH